MVPKSPGHDRHENLGLHLPPHATRDELERFVLLCKALQLW